MDYVMISLQAKPQWINRFITVTCYVRSFGSLQTDIRWYSEFIDNNWDINAPSNVTWARLYL